MSLSQNRQCPLCFSAENSERFQDKARKYYLCARCELLFVDPNDFLSPSEEKAEYDLHQNSPSDLRYRRFLEQMLTPMVERIPVKSKGLDFGSGPGPTLSVMFEELGHTMSIYDCFYANDPSIYEQTYQFITATEVVEHLHHPRQELERLWSCLQPGGFLGIMTQLWSEQTSFANWRYKDDMTHVCFFSSTSFQWLAKLWGGTLHLIDRNVRILEKH